jgi:hypothetical protein
MTSLLWWMSPEEAEANPDRLLQQVMAIGLPAHVREARRRWSPDAFRAALRTAPAGVFDPRSWTYWHTVLDLLPVPPLPAREIERPT